jgi:hypothetical protein
MILRNFGSLVLALLLAGLANAQESDFEIDAWIEQQVDKYIERPGVSTADRLMWCDPTPDCEILPLRAANPDDGLSIFVVVVSPRASQAELEFLIRQVEIIRAVGGNVLHVGSLEYGFAVALRNKLSDTRYHIPAPPRR